MNAIAVAVLLKKYASLTLDTMQEQIRKIKGNSEQRRTNIIKKLKKDMERVETIVKGLEDCGFATSTKLKHLIDNLQTSLEAILNNSQDDTPNISQVLTHFVDAYAYFNNDPELVSFHDLVYRTILTDLQANTKQPPQTLSSIKELLPHLKEEEYRALARELAYLKSTPYVEPTHFPKLYGLVNQFKLEDQLSRLGMGMYAQLPTHDIEYNRIMITTRDVLDGLQLIVNYLEQTTRTRTELFSGMIDVNEIVVHYQNQGIHSLNSGFEIAWGLIDQLQKRAHVQKDDRIGETVFVTTSFICAQEAMTRLAPHATLVLDGHGGAINCTFADKPNLMATDLLSELDELLNRDTNARIDHLVLQSCTSGTLKQNDTLEVFFPKDPRRGKARRLVLGGKDVTADVLFERVNDMQSLAAQVYQSFIQKGRTEIAFTFTEDLLCPGSRLGMGNIGIPKSAPNATYTPWPQNLQTPATKAYSAKSTTIVLDPTHRKAGEASAFFCQMAFIPKNFHDLGLIRQSERTSLESPATSIDSARFDTPSSADTPRTLSSSTLSTICSAQSIFSPSKDWASEEHTETAHYPSTAEEKQERMSTPPPTEKIDNPQMYETPPRKNTDLAPPKTCGVTTPNGQQFFRSIESCYQWQESDSVKLSPP